MRTHSPIRRFPALSFFASMLPLVLMGVTDCSGSGGLIAAWNFNEAGGEQARNKWPGPIAASTGVGEISLDGWGGGTEDFEGTQLNALFGDAPGSSLTLVAGPAVSGNGTPVDVSISTAGYQRIVASFATRGTFFGFNQGTWSWSTDGNVFTEVDADTSSNSRDWEVVTVDLSDFRGVDDQPHLTVRFMPHGSVSTAANVRIDNMKFNGEPIPEPDPSIAMREAPPAAS
jgi:hypothetical protein